MSALRVVTWNVHGCVGIDGVESPERIADVIRWLDPDVIGLQEMRELALRRIAELTGLTAVAGVTRLIGPHQFGNALLTRFQVEGVRLHDVSYRKREPRGVMDAMLRRPDGTPMRVVVTHFGLRAAERRRQADLLLELVREPGAPLLTVMGDFNEWRPFVKTLYRLNEHLGAAPPVRSFPSVLPVLPLDRVWVWPRSALVNIEARRGKGAWRASDHLPVTALVKEV